MNFFPLRIRLAAALLALFTAPLPAFGTPSLPPGFPANIQLGGGQQPERQRAESLLAVRSGLAIAGANHALSTGLSSNWAGVTDNSVSSTNLTVDSTQPTVFYRLVFP